MVDALVVAKLLAKPVVGHALGYAKKHLSPNERMREAWTERIDEFVVEHAQALTSAAQRMDLVEARLDDAEAEAAFLNYAEEAMREAAAERRTMLAHAAAAILGVDALTLAEHSKVQRMLRMVDPGDILFLRRLALTCGTFINREDRKHPDRVRRIMLQESDSRDALSGAFVEEYSTDNWGADNERARVTRFGKKVLLVMKTYLSSKPIESDIPGREHVPGSRDEEAARTVLSEFVDIVNLAFSAKGQKVYDAHRWYALDGKWTPPRSDGMARLSLSDVVLPQGLRERLGKQPDDAKEVGDYARRVCVSGAGENVQIEGPQDVLTWLADDVDAMRG